MGAIQQAFNQALAVGAIAAHPFARAAAEKRFEQKNIAKAEAGAEAALNRMEEAFGSASGTYSDQQLSDLVQEAYEAQETSYRARPSLQKGALRAELYEHVKEWTVANEAADAVSKYRTAHKDQKANMDAARQPKPDETGGAK